MVMSKEKYEEAMKDVDPMAEPSSVMAPWQKKDGSLSVKGVALKDAVMGLLDEKEKNMPESVIARILRKRDPTKYGSLDVMGVKVVLRVLLDENKIIGWNG